jgi:hypothetical protein
MRVFIPMATRGTSFYGALRHDARLIQSATIRAAELTRERSRTSAASRQGALPIWWLYQAFHHHFIA